MLWAVSDLRRHKHVGTQTADEGRRHRDGGSSSPVSSGLRCGRGALVARTVAQFVYSHLSLAAPPPSELLVWLDTHRSMLGRERAKFSSHFPASPTLPATPHRVPPLTAERLTTDCEASLPVSAATVVAAVPGRGGEQMRVEGCGCIWRESSGGSTWGNGGRDPRLTRGCFVAAPLLCPAPRSPTPSSACSATSPPLPHTGPSKQPRIDVDLKQLACPSSPLFPSLCSPHTSLRQPAPTFTRTSSPAHVQSHRRSDLPEVTPPPPVSQLPTRPDHSLVQQPTALFLASN